MVDLSGPFVWSRFGATLALIDNICPVSIVVNVVSAVTEAVGKEFCLPRLTESTRNNKFKIDLDTLWVRCGGKQSWHIIISVANLWSVHCFDQQSFPFCLAHSKLCVSVYCQRQWLIDESKLRSTHQSTVQPANYSGVHRVKTISLDQYDKVPDCNLSNLIELTTFTNWMDVGGENGTFDHITITTTTNLVMPICVCCFVEAMMPIQHNGHYGDVHHHVTMFVQWILNCISSISQLCRTADANSTVLTWPSQHCVRLILLNQFCTTIRLATIL